MDYSKYYTPLKIADFLISKLEIPVPHSAIDICCGSCNLLHAAKKRWNNIELIGVDIIDLECDDVKYSKMDGRKYAIENKNKYHLILANPPFDYLEKKCEYSSLFDEMNFSYETSRLEIEMLFANLIMLNDNGVLLIIMPNTFVIGQKYLKIRKFLAQNYSIKKIFFLPEDTFGTTNISSCALIIKKEDRKKNDTEVLYIKTDGNNYSAHRKEKIIYGCIENGIWNNDFSMINSLINIDIKRGSTSSQFFSNTGEKILHTSTVADDWRPSIRYVQEINTNSIYASDGDIIINRIGKAAGGWHKYKGKRILISDCLFVIKDKDNFIGELLKNEKYPYKLRGVATKYITKSDVKAWLGVLHSEKYKGNIF